MFNRQKENYNYFLYDFYPNNKQKFFSIYYQSSIPLLLSDINSLLEFGIGRGSTVVLQKHYGLNCKTVDFNPIFIPDETSTILDYESNLKFDIVSAFQVLEHNPLNEIEAHLKKMAELSKKYVYISVPYSGRWISFNLEMNFMPTKFGRFRKNLIITWPRIFKKTRPIEEYKKRKDKYNPHWWEVGDKNVSKKIFQNIINQAGLKINKTFHNEYFPYHIFYLLEKND